MGNKVAKAGRSMVGCGCLMTIVGIGLLFLMVLAAGL